MIADCLKELRTLFMEVASHLPKVNITLEMGGITVTDEKSKVHAHLLSCSTPSTCMSSIWSIYCSLAYGLLQFST